MLLASLLLSVKAQTKKDTVESENWRYSEEINEMTGKKTFRASTESSVVDEDTQSSITVRYMDGKNEVLFIVASAMFNIKVGAYQIDAKFDDGKIEKYLCDKSDGDNFQLVFIYKNNTFIKKLKESKKLLIQCSLYQKGEKVFKFDTSNLKWGH